MAENGNRTIHEWLRHIDETNSRDHRAIIEKLDNKVDQERCDRREDRLEALEDKHQNLAVKVAGIAGGISIVIGIAGWIFGG